jgi:hypothetical protein
MSIRVTYPTTYSDVNVVVDELLTAVQDILDQQLVGFYLNGSLALGDFDLEQSDIDFVVVTAESLPDTYVPALREMHEQLAAGRSKWGRELEGIYIPQAALRRYDPESRAYPSIERGERLKVEQPDSGWVIQSYILREYGVALVGPPPQTLIDPIGPEALQWAVVELLNGWWASQVEATSKLKHSGYQRYAILTMCRMLYTLEYGTIVSKPVAAQWVQKVLDRRWAGLAERALQCQVDLTTLDETKDFIRYTIQFSERFDG